MKGDGAHRHGLRACVLAIALSLSACSIASAAMKAQLSNQCGTVGLKGCPELAEGAIAYLGGNQAEAEGKLRAAAAQNVPEDVRRFTMAIQPIIEVADADTAKALRAIIAILEGQPPAVEENDKASVAKASAGAPSADGPRRTEATQPAALDLESLRAGMANPAAGAQALACDAAMIDGRTCQRVRLLLGPFVLTNLYSSGGCNNELFVTSADSKATWTILTLSGDRMSISGHFPVDEGQSLYVGSRGEEPTLEDLRCSVVWSGFRPAATTEAH